MSDTNTSGGTATEVAGAAGAAVGKESRTNHAPAKAHPITDSVSAQAFADAAIEATRNDKAAAMYNGSGFVTPSALDRQDVPNRVRMIVSLINSLAGTVESDGDEGTAATEALSVVAQYAGSASDARTNAKNERILAQAAAIQAARGKGKAHAGAR